MDVLAVGNYILYKEQQSKNSKKIIRNNMNWIKNFILVFVVTGLSFEVLSFIATKLELFLINETPTIYRSLAKDDYPDIVFGRTEREKWGLACI